MDDLYNLDDYDDYEDRNCYGSGGHKDESGATASINSTADISYTSSSSSNDNGTRNRNNHHQPSFVTVASSPPNFLFLTMKKSINSSVNKFIQLFSQVLVLLVITDTSLFATILKSERDKERRGGNVVPLAVDEEQKRKMMNLFEIKM